MDIIPRREAKGKGLTHYFVGKLCKRNHKSERFVSTGACVQCNKDHNKQWYADNSDYYKEYTVQWREDNPEQTKATSAKLGKKWREDNPHKVAANCERRNKYLKEHTPEEANLEAIAQVYKDRDELNQIAMMCGADGTDLFVVDHYTSISKGGKHEASNLQIILSSENARKGCKDPEEFYLRRLECRTM